MNRSTVKLVAAILAATLALSFALIALNART
jgi:hypothetical protein